MRLRLLARVSTPLSTATVVAHATIMLTACGPGAGAPAASDSSAAPQSQSAAAPSPFARSAATTPLPDASSAASTVAIPAWGANASNAANAASDPVQSAQASLAADSDQVTPVMSYAPGDGAQTEASNGNDSSRPVTSSH
ncbi:hypothetical protein C7402_102413 [Paraburkholderia unamae]|uniref:Lipoprotein n=2 Tax=Paraburkholderia unamae TaxID=219649 RepID=A0ABX5KYK7_9BURK|nr:hypothetical protein C7402_102413 [Paraburkholderia unamae]